MWKPPFPLLVCVRLILMMMMPLFTFTDGLECYSCYAEDSLDNYEDDEPTGAEDDDDLKGSSSCKWGRQPGESLSQLCPGAKVKYGKGIQQVCMQMYYSVPHPEVKRNLKLTVRDCTFTRTSIGEAGSTEERICSRTTLKHLEEIDADNLTFNDAFANVGCPVSEHTMVDICHCNYDNCNAVSASVGMAATVGGIILGVFMVALSFIIR